MHFNKYFHVDTSNLQKFLGESDKIDLFRCAHFLEYNILMYCDSQWTYYGYGLC